VKEEEIAAPIDVVFETILEQMGPENEAPETGRMPMKLEAWPGARWYRDLGNDGGHFWGSEPAIGRSHTDSLVTGMRPAVTAGRSPFRI
jgi:hypothetical protein